MGVAVGFVKCRGAVPEYVWKNRGMRARRCDGVNVAYTLKSVKVHEVSPCVW
jgi:hypothetical protein